MLTNEDCWELGEAFDQAARAFDVMTRIFEKIYDEHPVIFKKSPAEMSASDKMAMVRAISIFKAQVSVDKKSRSPNKSS